MLLLWSLLLLFSSLPQAGLAIDPGRVEGSLQVDNKAIALTHAYAHLHDNAEGLLDHPRELRLVFVDREVPQEFLAGISLLPLEQLAKEGRVQGLLLRLDPGNHKCLVVTVLYPPTEPGQTLLTRVINSTTRTSPLELKIGSFNRVAGAFEHQEDCRSETRGMPRPNHSLRFSAPLFHETPVTAFLTGQKAQTGSHLRVLREKAWALEKRDLVSVQRLSTADANRRTWAALAQAGPEAESFLEQAAAEMQRLTTHLQRVVVRSDRAIAIFSGKQWHPFRREGGEWKSDN